MTPTRPLVAASALLTAALLLTSCGSGSGSGSETSGSETSGAASADSASAKKAFGDQAGEMAALYEKAVDAGEDQVTIYGPVPPQDLIDAFQERYPEIKIVAQNLSGAERLTRLGAEKSSGNHQGDVARDGNTPIAVLSEKGYCTEMEPIMPLYPDSNTLGSTVFETNLGIFGIVYNTDQVDPADVPKKWEDLLDPKWKGKITTVDPGAGGVSAFAFASMLVPPSNAEKYGLPFLEQLKAQDLQFVSQDPQMVQRVASGQNPLAVLVFSAYYQEVKKKGAPIGFSFPLEADNMTSHSLHCQLADAPHPLAAQLYINWILSPEGQTAQTKNGSFSLLEGVPAPEGFESIAGISQLETLPLEEGITGYEAPIKQVVDLFRE